MSDWRQAPHRRWNPLSRRWVLVSPHRTLRPWQGQEDAPAFSAGAAYDPGCYLCPGNGRASGARNPAYSGTYWFDNDFAALRADAPSSGQDDELLRAVPEAGLCRVLCYSPDHNLTMSRMSTGQIGSVVNLWREQMAELAAVPWLGSVQIFENRGTMMGASNPHPHGQLWASASVPDEIRIEAEAQQEYLERTGRTLLGAYLERELAAGERVVSANAGFVALVPFWAVWPFEIMVLPRRDYGWITEQSPGEDIHLSAILRDVTARYDNLFAAPFPYSMGLHQRPVRGGDGWRFHIHFYPPLLRSATVRKFLVGYEMLAEPQRDITPESAAERLRQTSPTFGA